MPRTRKQTASQAKIKIFQPRKWLKKISPTKAKKINKILGVLIILLGVILFAFPTFYQNFSKLNPLTGNGTRKVGEVPNKVNQKKGDSGPIKIDVKLLSEKEQVEPPSRVVLPGFKVDLPIVEAKVVNGFWELSETSASHGVGSASPGELGNMVVFAHARDDLFGPIRNIQKGAIVYVLTKDRWYKYEVKETKLVDPTDVEVIAPTSDETLTLYTCDGFLDSKRLIVTAKPQK